MRVMRKTRQMKVGMLPIKTPPKRRKRREVSEMINYYNYDQNRIIIYQIIMTMGWTKL